MKCTLQMLWGSSWVLWELQSSAQCYLQGSWGAMVQRWWLKAEKWMSLDRAPSSLCSILESRGPRIFLNALGGDVKEPRVLRGFQGEEATGPEVNGGHQGWTHECSLLKASLTWTQCPKVGKVGDQLFIAQSLREQLNLRTSFSSTPSATRSSKLYFILSDVVLEDL